VDLITGSGTPDGTKHPAFTVIDFDKEFMVPLNVHTYYTNLTEANLNPSVTPVWHELHDFLEEYGLKDMSPSSMKDLTERFFDDSDLASQYEWNTRRRAASKPAIKRHQKKYLCMQASETFEQKDCTGSPHINLGSLNPTDYLEYFIADWIQVSK